MERRTRMRSLGDLGGVGARGRGRDGDVYTRGLKTPPTQEMSCGQKLSWRKLGRNKKDACVPGEIWEQ